MGIRRTFRMETDEQLKRWDDRLALLIGLAMAVVIVGATVGGGVMLIRIYQQGTLPPGNPLSTIFASRMMIGAARLAVLFIGVFIVLSVLVHIRRGQWLTAAGPLRVSDSMRQLTTTITDVSDDVRLVSAENDRLKKTVAELTSEVRTSQQLLAQAQEQLRKTQK